MSEDQNRYTPSDGCTAWADHCPLCADHECTCAATLRSAEAERVYEVMTAHVLGARGVQRQCACGYLLPVGPDAHLHREHVAGLVGRIVAESVAYAEALGEDLRATEEEVERLTARLAAVEVCSHPSATAIDTTPAGPGKVWRCNHCGLSWIDWGHGRVAVLKQSAATYPPERDGGSR